MNYLKNIGTLLLAFTVMTTAANAAKPQRKPDAEIRLRRALADFARLEALDLQSIFVDSRGTQPLGGVPTKGSSLGSLSCSRRSNTSTRACSAST